MPMRPNFDSPLDLHHGNTRVDAKGPLNWDDTTGNCHISVRITQTVNGAEVVATGRSGGYDDDDPTWDAEARTNGAQLQPGTAHAAGVAELEDDDDIRWEEDVELRVKP
jgi:hypothetical protein